MVRELWPQENFDFGGWSGVYSMETHIDRPTKRKFTDMCKALSIEYPNLTVVICGYKPKGSTAVTREEETLQYDLRMIHKTSGNCKELSGPFIPRTWV